MKKQEKDYQSNKFKGLLNLVNDYYKSVIAILTFLGAITSYLLKFTEYLINQTQFSYYGIDSNLYDYSNKNFIYNLSLSIIFMFAFCATLYCFKQTKENIRNKKILKLENVINFFLIITSNLYIIISVSNKLNIMSIIDIIILIIFEYISSTILFKEEKEQDTKKYDIEQSKKFIINYLKVLPFIILLLIILECGRVCLSINQERQYRTINNNKVIVYSTNDYYLTLDCDINGKELIIYKGKQEKIDNNNVKSELKKFDKVVMK